MIAQNGGERRRLPVATLDGRTRGTVTALLFSPGRRAFVALTTLDQVWEVSVDPRAEPIQDGFVHDWRGREALETPGFLNPRRTPLAEPLASIALTDRPPWLDVVTAAGRTMRLNLDVRRVVTPAGH